MEQNIKERILTPLHVFFDALTSGGLYNEQGTLNAMLAFTPLSNFSYGLGISNGKTIKGLGHNGVTPGFVSFASVNPNDNTSVIFCCNSVSEHINGCNIESGYGNYVIS